MRALIVACLAIGCVEPSGAPRGVASVAQYDVGVFGDGDVPLSEGDVITGSAVADVYLQNGLIKYYPVDDTTPTGWLYRWNGTAYQGVFDYQGDGFAFVVPGGGIPDRITVVEKTATHIEVSCEWDAFDVDTGYLQTPGVQYRDWTGSRNFPDTSATPKYITETKLRKVVIIRYGAEGVELGMHSDPRIGPLGVQLPAQNNNQDFGEREIQFLGTGARVVFSSAGVTILHPDFGADDRWLGTPYTVNRHAGLGIDDSDWPPYSNPDHVARQHAGYPSEQTTGPYWGAALHFQNATTFPFLVYAISRTRLEFVAYQYAAGAYGQPTIHFVNEFNDASGVPYRTMVFLGASPYVSPDMTAEPAAGAGAIMAARASATFELNGQVALELEDPPTSGDPVTGTLEMWRGEEKGYLLFATEDGDPVSLTGLTLECQVKTAVGDADPPHALLSTGNGITHLSQTGDTLGGFYLLFSSSTTNAIPAGSHYLDVCVVSGGSRKYLVKPRRLIVRDVVNQP